MMQVLQLWRRIRQALAWPGLLGLVLLLIGFGVYVQHVVPQGVRLDKLQRDNASLKQRIDRAAKTGIPESSDQEELAKFYGFFTNTPLSDWLNKIYAAAANNQVVLEQGEYRITPSKNGKLSRYQITFPIKGSYLQIRKFVAEALEEVPVASLDDISFKREAIASAQVETRIKLTLFIGVEGVERK